MEIDIAIVNFYVIMIGICSALSSLVTEAIKITAKNAGKKWSSNLIALIDAVVVGGGVPIIFFAEELWHFFYRKGEDEIPEWHDMDIYKRVGGAIIAVSVVLLIVFIII